METNNWITHQFESRGHVFTIGEPQPRHVEELSFTMRMADRLEVWRSAGMKPRDALRWSLQQSAWSRVGLIDGQVATIWGLVLWGSVTSCMGSPWAMTSALVDWNQINFWKLSKFYVAQLRQMCPRHLEVNVDAEYDSACRWLKRLGFTLAPVQVNGYPFYAATIGEETKQCASR